MAAKERKKEAQNLRISKNMREERHIAPAGQDGLLRQRVCIPPEHCIISRDGDPHRSNPKQLHGETEDDQKEQGAVAAQPEQQIRNSRKKEAKQDYSHQNAH